MLASLLELHEVLIPQVKACAGQSSAGDSV